jgi:hypothetical protein
LQYNIKPVIAKNPVVQIDRRFKGCDEQRDHEAALADVGALSPTSTYFEGVEPLHFDRNHSRRPFFCRSG